MTKKGLTASALKRKGKQMFGATRGQSFNAQECGAKVPSHPGIWEKNVGSCRAQIATANEWRLARARQKCEPKGHSRMSVRKNLAPDRPGLTPNTHRSNTYRVPRHTCFN